MPTSDEALIQAAVRLAAAQVGNILWRNNVGALLDSRGIPVRFGLANESGKINRVLKSSDLIGIEQGTGRFLSYECKAHDWKYTGTIRERAQLNWIEFINSMGGKAAFVTDASQI